MDQRQFKDILARRSMATLCWVVLSFAFLIAFGLFHRAKPILATTGLRELFFSTSWHPTEGRFGLASFIVGTLWVTGIAIGIAVPLGLLAAVYLSEYAPRRVRELAKPMVDLLAGISPVIYGVWGILIIVPWVRDVLTPFFSRYLPFPPFLSDNYTGFSALAGGIVLSVMVIPIIVSVTEEVLRSVPFGIRESSLALGATRWETTKYAVLRQARAGVVAAVILGLSRAFGETIAVLMVAGCSLHGFPKSVFDTAYPLSALIANTYGEMMSIPLYDAAILSAALILLIGTALFNMIGWWILLHIAETEG